MTLVLIVEGFGDVAAFPAVVGKIGSWLNEPLYTVRPIRSRGWGSIKKAGGLEKWVGLAASRPECHRIVIAVDLDDGCATEEVALVQSRVQALEERYGVEIQICFCLREFEAWLLHIVDILSGELPDYDWLNHDPPDNPESFRDAKGTLQGFFKEHYGESRDQEIFARKIPPEILYDRCRSYRRFVKAVSGHNYGDLAAAL